MSKRSETLTGTQYIATAFFSCTASNEVLLPSGKVIFVNLGILMYRVMQQQMRSIEEARPPKHRCFLLFPYVCHIYVKKIPPTGVNVEFWDLLPTLWSLRRPRKRYSGTLTEREISKNGKWRVNGQRNYHFIDRYLTLVTCMNESIVRIAQEHGKTPQVHCPIQNRIINWKYP